MPPRQFVHLVILPFELLSLTFGLNNYGSFSLNQNSRQTSQERSYCTLSLQKNGCMNLKVSECWLRKEMRLDMHMECGLSELCAC